MTTTTSARSLRESIQTLTGKIKSAEKALAFYDRLVMSRSKPSADTYTSRKKAFVKLRDLQIEHSYLTHELEYMKW